MAPACWLCGSVRVRKKRVQKTDNGLSVWNKAIPQLLPWCQTLLFLPVCHWCLSSCYPASGAQKEWVWVGKSVCVFFKRNCLGLQKFLPLTQSPLVFVARTYEDLSSLHWNSVLGVLVWDLDSLLPRYPSQVFIHHMCMWDQPIPHLHPSSQSGWVWFL